MENILSVLQEQQFSCDELNESQTKVSRQSSCRFQVFVRTFQMAMNIVLTQLNTLSEVSKCLLNSRFKKRLVQTKSSYDLFLVLVSFTNRYKQKKVSIKYIICRPWFPKYNLSVFSFHLITQH
jgi:hypothetical protein